MIIIMTHSVTEIEIDGVVAKLEERGFNIHLSRGVERTIIGAIGDKTRLGGMSLEALPGVESIVPILEPYKLAGRAFNQEDTVVRVRDLEIGGGAVHVMAGPCAVESRAQLMTAAERVQAAGAAILRGGAYKPRTSPYSFQGMAEEGLKLLAEARETYGLAVITEAMDISTLPLVAQYADIIQIGTRNMQNFNLLRELGAVDKPVMLKRGLSSTIEEWLMSAEYILSAGNPNVILCERGIRTFETYTRNTLDLAAVAVVKHLSHLPVIVDPSHALGKWRFVGTMSKAAVAAGADGLLIEVHPHPAEALCDGAQSLTPDNFTRLMDEIKPVAEAVGRCLA